MKNMSWARSSGKNATSNPPGLRSSSNRKAGFWLPAREGKRFVTDGPFAETREQLGGYYLVDAKNLDDAIGIAEKIPMARKGTVEVRPVIEIAGLPI